MSKAPMAVRNRDRCTMATKRSDTSQLKSETIRFSLLQVSRYAASQHVKIYCKEVTEEKKKEFRHHLRSAIAKFSKRYSRSVSEQDHLKNIAKIKKTLDGKCRNTFDQGRISIGVVQKAFNLYLKLLWCLNEIPEPPHCPVDRIIIGTLPVKQRVSWTKMRSLSEYEDVIANLSRLAKKDQKSLAHWELVTYEKLS